MGLMLGTDTECEASRHSGLAARLRMGVLDSLLSYPLGLARIISDAAIFGNPDMDVEKAPQIIKMKAYDAMATIDYMTGGRSGTDLLQAERMKAVEKYKAMRNKLLKGS